MKRATSTISKLVELVDISIHALVKRATPKGKLAIDGQTISIHALVKRATYDFKTTKTAPKDFNPRPREEGDVVYT